MGNLQGGIHINFLIVKATGQTILRATDYEKYHWY